MKIPEAVVFDLGKVLVDFDYHLAAQRFSTRGTMSPQDITNFIDHSPWLFRYETGLMTQQEFYDEFRTHTGFLGEINEFIVHFSDIFSPIEAMIEWHERLRLSGMPTYIFSNTNELAIAHIRANFPFFNRFTDYILSYEHGAMKPDAKIYEVVERVTGKRGCAILYLDDRPENIAAGNARAWQTILQESPEKTLKAVKKVGL